MKNFYTGIAFGVVIVFLLYAFAQVIPSVTGYITNTVNPKFEEKWECSLWRTDCGLVQDATGVNVNGTQITWESLGCPVIDCYKEVKTRTSTTPVNITKQPVLQ